MGKGEGKGEGKGKFLGMECKGVVGGKKMEDKVKRSCTDILFLGLFFCFCIGVFYIAGWCFDNGQPYRIAFGADSWGNVCGKDNTGLRAQCDKGKIGPNCGLDMSARKHLFYSSVGADGADALDNSQKVMICAAACPEVEYDCTDNITLCQNLGVCLTHPYSQVGPEHPDAGIVVDGVGTGCPEGVGVSLQAGFLMRCLPDVLEKIAPPGGVVNEAIKEQVNSFVSYTNADSYISDVIQSFAGCLEECLYLLLIALGLSYLIVILMKWFVRPMVYVCLFLAIVSSICVTWFLWDRAKYTEDSLQVQRDAGVPITSQEENERDFYTYSSYLFLIFTVLLTAIIIFCRNEIKAAINVYRCASDALQKMPSMLLTPLFMWVFLVTWAFFWIFVMIHMVTADNFHTINATVGEGYGHVKYVPMEEYDNFFWFYLFALFWISQFFVAVEQMILAGCVTHFYIKGGEPLKGVFCRASWNVFRYHLGTACLGSLIIAVVQFIRSVFEYIKHKTDGDEKTAIQKFFEKCLTCCLWCLEKCLKFINKNAYIETMLYGMDFCSATCTAFKTLLANLIKIAMLNFVGGLVIFTIKLAVACTTAFIAFEWIKDLNEVPLTGLVVFILALVAWMIADAFASIYDMTADTLMLCYCEDLDVHKEGNLIGPKKLVGRLAKAGGKGKKSDANQLTAL